MCEVSPAGDLQFQIDKREFDVFILCRNALDIEAHSTQACCQDSNHASTVLNLNTQANWVRPFYDIIPMERDQTVRLLSEFHEITTAVPVDHEPFFLAEVALDWVAGQRTATFGVGHAHAFGAPDAQRCAFAADHGFVLGVCQLRHNDVRQGITKCNVDK